MKQVFVGGQLVGRRIRGHNPLHDGKVDDSNLLPWKTFSPLVTPPLKRNDDGTGRYVRQTTERFVLLPSQRFVTVLAYKTGKMVAYLVPSKVEEDNNQIDTPMITSATLATFPVRRQEAADVLRLLDRQNDKSASDRDDEDDDEEEAMDLTSDEWAEDHVLLVGCHDGSLQEFALGGLTDPATYQQHRKTILSACGSYNMNGICLNPRRVLQACQGLPLVHLSSVGIKAMSDPGLVVYAVVSEKQEQLEKDVDKQEVTTPVPEFSLRRIFVPQHCGSSGEHDNNDDNELETETPVDCVLLDRFKCPPSSHHLDSSPFSLEAVVRDESNRVLDAQAHDTSSRQMVFVVVASPTHLSVYCDNLSTDGRLEASLRNSPVIFNMPKSNGLASVTISPNGADVACGHFEGDIRILCDVLTVVAQYYRTLQGKSASDMPYSQHPSKTVIRRRVHWHAHPVASLAYQSTGSMVDPMLHSGGDESVLVTWQLSRGTYRPADVLPRLSKGGIIRICVVEGDEMGPSGILVASEDNTLQLFESHNRSLRWKVQGLAYRSKNESSLEVPMKAKAWSDPRGDASLLVLTGLPDAPGYIHWFDTKEQRVAGTLEVAPYNRVSKVERGDLPMPSPAITHCNFSESGDDLVTVDITPTENTSIGAFMLQDGRAPVGTVTTIRFWSHDGASKRPGMNMPYQLIAAMTFPHGPENFVSALAISNDGQCCCTVSNGEKAIRIWHKTHTVEEDDDDEDEQAVDANGRRRPLWLCRYRITSPSGFSNRATRPEGVAFSTDGSILAICYGNMITLWDHQEASFLTSLLHLEDDFAPVESICFLPLEGSMDMILTTSLSGVALQSPFARCGASRGWSWVLPVDETDDTIVTSSRVILDQELVAISIHNRVTNKSRIVFVDVVTGEPTKYGNDTNHISVEMAGGVVALSSDDSLYKKNPRSPSRVHKSFRLSVLTDEGELISLQTDDAADSAVHRPMFELESGSKVPRLPDTIPLASQPNKRARTMVVPPQEEDVIAHNHVMANFGSLVAVDGSSTTPVPTVELPSLSGGFARTFIGRNLARHHKSS